MDKLFLYDNGPSAMRLFQRPAIREVQRSQRFELAIACCADDAVLFEDLVATDTRLLVTRLPCSSSGALVDLRAWLPPEHTAIDLSLEAYEDTARDAQSDFWSVFEREFRRAYSSGQRPEKT